MRPGDFPGWKRLSTRDRRWKFRRLLRIGLRSMANKDPHLRRETRRTSLCIAFLVCLLALGGCAADSQFPDWRMGQTGQFWGDYPIHPYDVQNPRDDWIDPSR